MAGCGGNIPAQAPSCCYEGDKKNVPAESLVPEVAPEKANEGTCKCNPCKCNPCTCGDWSRDLS